MTRDKDTNRRFHTRYSLPVTDAALAVEREVIGANVGASGYTTVAQADALIPELRLRPGTLLLDVGAGAGRRRQAGERSGPLRPRLSPEGRRRLSSVPVQRVRRGCPYGYVVMNTV